MLIYHPCVVFDEALFRYFAYFFIKLFIFLLLSFRVLVDFGQESFIQVGFLDIKYLFENIFLLQIFSICGLSSHYSEVDSYF